MPNKYILLTTILYYGHMEVPCKDREQLRKEIERQVATYKLDKDSTIIIEAVDTETGEVRRVWKRPPTQTDLFTQQNYINEKKA